MSDEAGARGDNKGANALSAPGALPAGGKRWYEAVARCEREGVPYCLATVAAVSGSTPRAPGSKMVITAETCADTIGGGQFEQLVIDQARVMLAEGGPAQAFHHFPLAASALQCCGGSVTVFLEGFGLAGLDVTVFGAGHVGTRVVRLLDDLPARVCWIDNRAHAFPEETRAQRRFADDPPALVSELPRDSHVLVLTHDHQLDYALVAALLRADHRGSIGLIGSQTKAGRFRKRLLKDGFSEAAIDRVRCPVGFTSVPGKEPMAVAIAIVAELLQLHEQGRPAVAPSDLSWRAVKTALLRSSHEG